MDSFGSVLVIDSSEYGREKTKFILKGLGNLDVKEFPDIGSLTLGIENLRTPELIIIDIEFPSEKEGFEALSLIRSFPKTICTPIIVTTRLESSKLKNASLKFSVSDYIVKPFTSIRLENSIKALLMRKEKFVYDTAHIEDISLSFDDFIRKLLKLTERMKCPLSVLLITSSVFKNSEMYNSEEFEKLRVSAVDILLQTSRSVLRETDTLVSNQANDLLIVLPCADKQGAEEVSRKVETAAINEMKKLNIDYNSVFYSVNVTFPDDGYNFDSLMESACRKISHKETLDKITSIPFNTRKSANVQYNRFTKWF